MTNKNRLYGVLFVSLMANAFLLGFLVAHTAGPMPPFPPPHGRGPMPDMMMKKAVAVLDNPYRTRVRETIRQKQDKVDRERAQMGAVFDRLEPVFTAETFSPEKLKALELEISAHDLAMKENISSMMVEIATKLPDEQRILFFRELFSKNPPPFMPPDRQEEPR